MYDTEWFGGAQVDEQPSPPARQAWQLYVVLALVLILGPLLASCASPCQVGEEFVAVLGTNDSQVLLMRGHMEVCPR